MKERKKEEPAYKWAIESFIITFILSGTVSYISTNGVSNLNIVLSLLILVLVIGIGIFFDMIGVAVTVADQNHFHAKATKKVAGSKTSLKLIKNASKVSNICADVIGDICGVLSGAISATISIKITTSYPNISSNIQFIISALVASITVGGKALGKGIAAKNSTQIVHVVGKILNKISKK